MTCWANFDGDYNIKAWGPFFEAFPEQDGLATPASRLLMGAFKKGDEALAGKVMAWFDERIAKYSENPTRSSYFKNAYVKGHILAGKGDERILRYAGESFKGAWDAAAAGASSTKDPLELKEKCDIGTDHYHNDLALACYLAKAFDPPENPLAAEEAEPGAVFEDVTEKAGLGAVRAGRVASADYDHDGDPDLCFVGRLFRNEKGRTFTEVTKDAGLGRTGSGALFLDYDNDGYPDLLVNVQPHPFLYRNLGRKGKYAFEDVTARVGARQDRPGRAARGRGGGGHRPGRVARHLPRGLRESLSPGASRFPAPQSWRRHLRGRVRGPGDPEGRPALRSGRDLLGFRSGRRFPTSTCPITACFETTSFSTTAMGCSRTWGETTGTMGLPQKGAFGHTIGSCFGDVDNDGDLDLFCANLAHPRFIIQGFSNLSMLYINAGADGDFAFTDERRVRGIRFSGDLLRSGLRGLRQRRRPRSVHHGHL